MYYSINQQYLLRGWTGASCCVVNKETHEIIPVAEKKYAILLLCDGETEFEQNELNNEEKDMLFSLMEKGIVTENIVPVHLNGEQTYRKYDNRCVKSVFWSITGKCNYNCRHCYMNAPKGDFGELPLDTIYSIIDQIAECGVQEIEITGGEPFVRKDIWQIFDRINSCGIRVNQIYSNGWLINEHVLDELEKRGMKPSFSFSYDGIGWHDWMRGIKGAEKALFNAIDLCNKRGFIVTLEMCTHKGNIDTVRDTVNFIGPKVNSIKIGTVSDTELWKRNCEDNRMSYPEYLEKMIEYIPHFYEDGTPTNVHIGNVIRLHKGSKEYKVTPCKGDGTEWSERYLCGLARMHAYISPEGRLLPCMPMTAWKDQSQFPKVQDIGLKQGLSDSFFMNIVNARVKDLHAINNECAECEYRYKCCGGCRAAAVNLDNSLMGCDRDMCFMWKNGYVDKIREAAQNAVDRYGSNIKEIKKSNKKSGDQCENKKGISDPQNGRWIHCRNGRCGK